MCARAVADCVEQIFDIIGLYPKVILAFKTLLKYIVIILRAITSSGATSGGGTPSTSFGAGLSAVVCSWSILFGSMHFQIYFLSSQRVHVLFKKFELTWTNGGRS